VIKTDQRHRQQRRRVEVGPPRMCHFVWAPSRRRIARRPDQANTRHADQRRDDAPMPGIPVRRDPVPQTSETQVHRTAARRVRGIDRAGRQRVRDLRTHVADPLQRLPSMCAAAPRRDREQRELNRQRHTDQPILPPPREQEHQRAGHRILDQSKTIGHARRKRAAAVQYRVDRRRRNHQPDIQACQVQPHRIAQHQDRHRHRNWNQTHPIARRLRPPGAPPITAMPRRPERRPTTRESPRRTAATIAAPPAAPPSADRRLA